MTGPTPEPTDAMLGRLRGSLTEEEYEELVAMLKVRRDLPRADGGARARRAPKPQSSTPAAPSGRSRSRGGRRQFGHTWWGNAWVEALEQRAHLDPNRLPRGRTYARHGRVQQLEIEPGVVTAFVQGSRAVPYRVQVHIRALDDQEWSRLLDAVAAKAAHAAALLDGELAPGIQEDAKRSGTDLLPGPGEVVPSCSCPDWADPCKHSAAVCYLIADGLDDDPFTLLLLRGMPRNEVLAAIRSRRRSAAVTDPTPSGPRTIRARDLYARPRPPEDLPSRRDALAQLGHVPVGSAPGQPVPLAIDPPTASGIRADELTRLAGDAARRAFAMLTDGETSGLSLTPDLDVARRAAALTNGCTHPTGRELRALADQVGMPVHQLERRAHAWYHAGAEGVSILEHRWRPSPELLEEGRTALAEPGARVRAYGNALTRGDIQLRLARSGLWYRLDDHDGEWELHRPPASDPCDLL